MKIDFIVHNYAKPIHTKNIAFADFVHDFTDTPDVVNILVKPADISSNTFINFIKHTMSHHFASEDSWPEQLNAAIDIILYHIHNHTDKDVASIDFKVAYVDALTFPFFMKSIISFIT